MFELREGYIRVSPFGMISLLLNVLVCLCIVAFKIVVASFAELKDGLMSDLLCFIISPLFPEIV